MKKLKIYLDTSVISHLEAPDTPEKMSSTLKFWEKIKNNQFEIVMSDVTLQELKECREPKKTNLLNFLKLIKFNVVPADDKTIEIAKRFIDFGILKEKSFDDCKHIAAAIVSECDAIASWNFKHIVSHKTIKGVKKVTTLYEKPDLLIYTPESLVEL